MDEKHPTDHQHKPDITWPAATAWCIIGALLWALLISAIAWKWNWLTAGWWPR